MKMKRKEVAKKKEGVKDELEMIDGQEKRV